MQSTLPQFIIDWFLKRGVTEVILKKARIHWNGNAIVIPVFDKEGKLLFCKFRRDPRLDDTPTNVPKYKYEAGAQAALYNVHTIKSSLIAPIFICEGELDALRMNTFGQIAVSSSGGAGTFDESWVPLFEGRRVYICYDKDDAGVKGAIRVQQMLPHAKIVLFPNKFSGKDITDYFHYHTFGEFVELTNRSRSYPVAPEIKEMPKTKSALEGEIRKINVALEELMEIKRENQMRGEPYVHIEIMLEVVLERHNKYKKILNEWKKPVRSGNNDVEDAKKVPMSRFIRIDSTGLARCVWHTDKHPSMHYNDFDSKYPNTVKCFSCSRFGDVIDVVMQINNVDFKKAIEIILRK